MRILKSNDTAYNIVDYPYTEYRNCKTLRNKRGVTYYNIDAAFDIETTNIQAPRHKDKHGKTVKDGNDFAFMYHWQFCIHDKVVFGRTWEEFQKFITAVCESWELSENRVLVVYVHNLAFEFQFIRNFFEWSNIFARKKRKPLRALSKCGIEFRCSYSLSNMSLEKFCENTPGIKHPKLAETYDYEEIRYPVTPMKDNDLCYCYNDVAGLCECIQYLLKEDTILSIPMTSTGYVRRDFRKAMQSNPKNKTQFKRNRLTPELYTLLKDAFRGGDTHANYLYTDEVVKNVYSYDEASAYPGIMMRKKFPMHFIKVNETRFSEVMKNKNTGKIFRCRLFHVKHRIHGGMPYMSVSMCRLHSNIRADNGRVLSADFVELKGITDIDYEILRRDYEWERMEINDLYQAKLEYLPDDFRNQIMHYYYLKCTLKGIPEKEYEYMKSKNKLNSAYGMMVTDIASPEVCIEQGEWIEKPVNLEDSLNKYYSSYSSFLSYQWGIWVTAYARQALRKAIYVCGELGKNCIYIDTDSVKTDMDISESIDSINAEIVKESEECGIDCHVDYNGERYQLGVYEYEGCYDEFKTLGAKKYVVKKYDKKKKKKLYTVTIAGLNKKNGSDYINEHGIDAFKIGTVFYPSGNLDATYNDCDIHTITIDGHTFTTASNIALVPAEYTLGVTNEYFDLFSKCK